MTTTAPAPVNGDAPPPEPLWGTAGFATLGQDLRSARVESGLSEDQVFRRTRIKPEFIESMEAGAFERLPQAYARLIIQNYAEAVDLPPKVILGRYEELLAPPPPAPEPEPEDAEQAGRRRWPTVVLVALVALAGVAAVVALRPGWVGLQEEVAPLPPAEAGAEGSAAEPVVVRQPREGRLVRLDGQLLRPSFYPLQGDSLTFSVRTLEPVELTVVADGQELFRGWTTTDTLTWRAARSFDVISDVPAGTTFALQGQPLALAPAPGDRRRFELTRSYLWLEEIRLVTAGAP